MPPEQPPITPRKLLVIFVEIILVLLLAMVLVSLVQMYGIAPITVDGASMESTLHTGDKVYINKAFSSLKRGDVVVCYLPSKFGDCDESGYSQDWWRYVGDNDDTDRCPASATDTFDDFIDNLPFIARKQASDNAGEGEIDYYLVIKRVVALPGDRVKVENGVLYVNGEVEGRANSFDHSRYGDYPEHLLAEGEYFLLGDNRSVSRDSHIYGPVRGSWILGKVVFGFSDKKLKTDL